jgi:hypothetical protein
VHENAVNLTGKVVRDVSGYHWKLAVKRSERVRKSRTRVAQIWLTLSKVVYYRIRRNDLAAHSVACQAT